MIKETEHNVHFGNASNLSKVEDESVSLVVTSPPYPMIEMWDESFSAQNSSIRKSLDENLSQEAFELMHNEMDKVWKECHRVLEKGGIACINIGDATRTINKKFQLFPNHARIISSFINLGFSNLPNIIWRKQTNAPNKFMGSGMLPPGAYVTLEHEFILIFRKGNKREFSNNEKENRRESSYFWEERNEWFSDLWNFKGTSQLLNKNKARERSAAYPFELPYRLINMFSTKGDTVLDPYLGTGTTTLASIATGRNSIGYELEEDFSNTIRETVLSSSSYDLINNVIRQRIQNHKQFVEKRIEQKGESSFKHKNKWFDFPVITRQEKEIIIQFTKSIESLSDSHFKAHYITDPLHDFQGMDSLFSLNQSK